MDYFLSPSIVLGAVAVLIAYWAFQRLLYTTKSLQALDLPVLYSKDDDIVQTLEEGHRKYPDTPFALGVPGQQLVVLPVSEIHTVKALPESHLSIKKHHYNQFLGEYSYMGTKADEFDDAMRYLLTRNTPIVLESFTAEIDYALQSTVHLDASEWTRIKPRSLAPRIATILSGRAFVGLPLSRDEEWIAANVNYTGDVSRAWIVLRFYPHFLRPLIAPFLKEVKALEASKALITRKIRALLERRAQQKKGNDASRVPGGELVDWFESRYKRPVTVPDMTRDQLLATFASIYNLSNALSYILFDLAAYPDVVQELRDELDQVLGDRAIDKHTLARLRKLDSFVRESQRLRPTSLVNIPRIPFVLH